MSDIGLAILTLGVVAIVAMYLRARFHGSASTPGGNIELSVAPDEMQKSETAVARMTARSLEVRERTHEPVHDSWQTR